MHMMLRTYGRPVAALALSALLLLGGCGSGTEAQDSAVSSTETQGQTAEVAEATQVAQPEITMESQSIGLEGIGNARELGGYVAADGRSVRHGLLLRTAALGKATQADIDRLLDTYHLATVLDFRMEREVESSPELELEGVRELNVHIIDEDAVKLACLSLPAEDLEALQSGDKVAKLKIAMKLGIVGDQMYVNFLSHDEGKRGYTEMFDELLALPEGRSLLFHCTQGKDRTGLGAMLILTALGVNEDTIMTDYLLTNDFNADLIATERQGLLDGGMSEEEVDRFMIAMDQVYPETMTNALVWMRENYGSAKGYIESELGVTEEEFTQLQDKFLE